MGWLGRLFRAWRRRRTSADLRDEISAYADLIADEHRAQGVTPEEARRLARASIGGVEGAARAVEDGLPGRVLEQFLIDARYALRGLRRSPGLTLAVVATLSVGIGVTAAVFSVVDASILKAVPYRDIDRLVDLGHTVRAGGDVTTMLGLENEEVEYWRQQRALFEGVERYQPVPDDVTDDPGGTIHVSAMTPGMLPLLGLAPEAGRLFTDEEARVAAPVVVISDGFWHRQFAANVTAIGSTLELGGLPVTVIGVTPPTFRYRAGVSGKVDLWKPLGPTEPGETVFRLRSPLTIDSAGPALQVADQAWQRARGSKSVSTPTLVPFQRATSGGVSPMSIMLGLAGLVLAIICANITSLLHTRCLARDQELRLRAALGASRWRIARLIALEALGLCVLGAIGASALTFVLVRLLPTLVPPRMASSLFAIAAPAFDGRVIDFLLLLVAASALICSLPVWVVMRSGLRQQSLHVSPRSGLSKQTRRTLSLLQGAQTAIAVLLVVAGVLVGGSFVRMMGADLGFDADGLYSASVLLKLPRYSERNAQLEWVSRTTERLRALPGVANVALGTPPPTKGSTLARRADQSIAEGLSAAYRKASPGYFETVGVALLAGREFQDGDGLAGEPVTIVSDSLARALWPGQAPVGQLMRLMRDSRVPPARVVGVAADVSDYEFRLGKPRYAVYVPVAVEDLQFLTVIVRATRTEPSIMKPVLDVLNAGDAAAVVVTRSGPVTGYYDQMETYAQPRLFAVIVAVFASLGLLMASIGLYGLLTYVVAQRQREIGVRIALGSTVGQVQRLVAANAFRPVLAGLLVGSLAAVLTGKYIASLLYGFTPRDPVAFAISVFVLLCTALASAILPLRRATGIDPIRALRIE